MFTRHGTSPPPSASSDECFDCVSRLAQRHLLVTSPSITSYLKPHEPLLYKLGELAFTQYATGEPNLERVAGKCGYSLDGEDIKDSRFVLPPSPDGSLFLNNIIKAWLAAYYVRISNAEQIKTMQGKDVKCLLADDDFKMYIQENISQKLNIVRLLITFSRDHTWSLVNMGLKKVDIENLAGRSECGQVAELLLSCNDLRGAGSSLARLMLSVTGCESINLCKTGLVATDIEDITDVVKDTKLATKFIYLHGNNLRGGGHALGQLMLAMLKVRCWDFSMVNLDSQDIHEMAWALDGHHLEVDEVHLDSTCLTEAGLPIGNLMKALPLCKCWLIGAECAKTQVDIGMLSPQGSLDQYCDSLAKEVSSPVSSEAFNEEVLSIAGEHNLEKSLESSRKKEPCDKSFRKPNDEAPSIRTSSTNDKERIDRTYQTTKTADKAQYEYVKGLNNSDLSEIATTLAGELVNIGKIELQGNFLKGGGLSLGVLMSVAYHCKHWNLAYTGLTAEDMLGITEVVGDTTLNTEEMFLEGNSLTDAGLYLGKLFLAMKNGQIWDLSWSDLGLNEIKGLVETIDTKVFHKTKEVKLQGNDLAGAGVYVGRLMTAMHQAKRWDFSNTHMGTTDFTQLAAGIGKHLKAETLVLDGSEQYYGDEDKATFSPIMSRCLIEYTNRHRGNELGEVTMRVEPPHLELTLTDQQVPGNWWSVLGLPDQGCVLGGVGAALMLDARGQETRRYQAYHHDQRVWGLTVHKSTLFMIQGTSISRVASFDSSPPPQRGPPAGSDQPAGTTGTVAAVTHYQVPGAETLRAGLALDPHTLVLVDVQQGLQGTVCRYQLGSSRVHVLVRDLEWPRAISRLGQGEDAIYLVTEEVAHHVRLYDETWEPLRTIGRHGSGDGELDRPTSTCVTPEDTLLVADRDNSRISEFCLDGTFLSHPLHHLNDQPWGISLQDNHLWLLRHPFNRNLRRYELYQQQLERV